jgi:sugar lactone lactonase YvrE
MKHIGFGAGLLAALLLTACGGGGGGGGSAGGSGGSSSSGASYTFQTEIFSPVASQNSASLSALNNPRFMTFDSGGNYLYVAGGSDNQVIRIGSDGVQTIMTGFGGGPVGVVINNSKLYVTQTGGLYSLDLSALTLTNGVSNSVTPTFLNTSPACSNCLGMVMNGGTIYAARSGSANSVFTYDIANNVAGSFGLSVSTNVTGMAFSNDMNSLYATDYSQTGSTSFGVNVFTVSTSLNYASHAQIGNQPYAIAVASNGDVYVSNYAGHTVTRVHGTSITTFLDSTQVCHPTGLAIKGSYLYVANEPNCAGQNQTRGYIRRATIDLS